MICSCRSEPIEELWQAWGQPDIWRLPHGHITKLAAGLDGPRPSLARPAPGSPSKNQRLIAPLAKLIDWSFLQAVTLPGERHSRGQGRRETVLEERGRCIFFGNFFRRSKTLRACFDNRIV